MMHVLILLGILYLFGATLLLMWEADPIITGLIVIISIGYTILEDLGK